MEARRPCGENEEAGSGGEGRILKDWVRPRQGGLPGREDKAVTGVEKELRENVGEPLLAIIG